MALSKIKNNFTIWAACCSLASLTLLGGCAPTETHRTLEANKVASYQTAYHGPKHRMVVGQFNNRSNYLQGVFSSNTDRLGNQSKTILKTHLQMTNRFTLVDRDMMNQLASESKISGVKQQLKGAEVAISGQVTEFGRKTIGDQQFFGILGSGKKQIAYAKVALNVVNVQTSEVIFASLGAGEYELSEREVIGFGSKAGYDSTLNGKVLDLAITEAVNGLVLGLEAGQWTLSN